MKSTIPDWRDAAAYPSCFDDWDTYRWAWEFLRRNRDYQNDYAYYMSLPDWTEEYGKTGKLSGRSFRPYEPMAYRYCNPPSLPGETGEAYEARMESAGIDFEHEPLEEYLMGKWGIGVLIDPCSPIDVALDLFHPYFKEEQDAPPPWLIGIPSERDRELLGRHCPYPATDAPGQITLRFDVRYSIPAQIKLAEALLHEEKELARDHHQLEAVRKKGPQKEKFPDFLRCLDASNAGATTKEAAACIFPFLANELPRDPGITRTEYALSQAKKLVTGGYLGLLKWGP